MHIYKYTHILSKQKIMRSDKIWRETENKSMTWWEYRFLNIQAQTEAGGVTKQPRKQHLGGDAC